MEITEGTLREWPVASTIDILKNKLDAFGITRVAHVTGLDNVGIPVATAIRPNAKHLTTSQGKGLSIEAAWVSAVMESIEAWHAENPIEAAMHGSYQQLIHQHSLLDPYLFSASMYVLPSLAHWSCDWIAASHLHTQITYYMPKALISMDSTQHMPEYSLWTVNSNGLAAGNTLDEAICHALFELIERDALSTWSKLDSTHRQATKIYLPSIQSPVLLKLIHQLEQASQEVKLWDITSSYGIPSYQCSIIDKHLLRGLGIFRGYGCHALKEIAMIRAITEAAQSRLTLISGSRDDIFPSYYSANKKLTQLKATPEGSYDFEARKDFPITADFKQLKLALLEHLKIRGINDIYMVNHTHPVFDIPVVHLFAPGLIYEGSRI